MWIALALYLLGMVMYHFWITADSEIPWRNLNVRGWLGYPLWPIAALFILGHNLWYKVFKPKPNLEDIQMIPGPTHDERS